MYKRVFILLLSSLSYLTAICQKADTGRIVINLPERLPAIIVNGDTLPYVDLGEVLVLSNRVFKSYDEAIKYYTLQRDIKIVYPYAIMAEVTFAQCEEAVKNMPDNADRKHYLKTTEKQLMKQYSDELKNLTVKQGRLLIKLIDRQTGETSYDMVKELRGSFSAFLWQTVACLFGNNLKSTYDIDGEDKEIEHLITLIEVGAI